MMKPYYIYILLMYLLILVLWMFVPAFPVSVLAVAGVLAGIVLVVDAAIRIAEVTRNSKA